MSAATASIRMTRAVLFYRSTIGKKAVMAATGVILFSFVVGHLLGNLQIYIGPEQLNSYAKKLHALGPLLWVIRLVLLATVVTHIVAALQLWLLNREARPTRYVKLSPVGSTYASRTMILSGPIIGAFIVYHLLHFTTGHVHPDFNHEMDVYRNVITGFQQPLASLFYIVAVSLVGLHLYHGVWSMFQSVGVSHPRYTPWLKRLALAAALFLVVGNVSIPLSVMAGILK